MRRLGRSESGRRRSTEGGLSGGLSATRSCARRGRPPRGAGPIVSASTLSGSRYGPEALEDVADEAQEDARVGDEELRLVVVAHERQSTLQDAPVVHVRDLGGEAVPLDPVRVVEEVEGVVDRQAEAGPPGRQALVHLGCDAHLADLVEHLGRHRQQPHQRRSGAGTEHDLQRPLEGEDLGIEAWAGDDVRQQVLDVVEHRGVGHRPAEVEDLLLEQELLFVVEHGPMVHRGNPRAPAGRPGPADGAAGGAEPRRSTGRGRGGRWYRRRA